MRYFSIALCVIFSLTLSACTSAEERAQEHYESALALFEEGDVDRAIIELRNALQLKGNHLEARHMLANLMLTARDNRQGAYSQYLRIAEQYPEDLKARITLARLAFSVGQWDEVERHGAKAEELAADDPQVQALTLARAYRTAVIDKDTTARAATADQVSVLLDTQPDDPVLRSLRIDSAIRQGALTQALEDASWLIEQDKTNQAYWRQRLELLIRMEDFAAVEEQLKTMVATFPDTAENKAMLFRFYMSREQIDAAEAFLRELAEAEEAEIAEKVDLIRFLVEFRDPESARAEINKNIETAENPAQFQVMAAGLDFDAGETDKAIATMEAVIAATDTEEARSERNNYQVVLSKMLLGTGNEVGARQLIEAVLADEPTQVEALKMLAVWLTEADEVEEAIGTLRQAVSAAPQDAQALTLMAQAYARAGQTDLSQDFLARAAQASGSAPAESMRYAQVLMSQERYRPAEDVLISALRLNSGNPELLAQLGQVYLAMEDFGRLEGVINALRQHGSPETTQVANSLEAERLNRTQGADQALAFLEDLAGATGADIGSQITLVRARLSTGDAEGALQIARGLLADDPENPILQYVMAAAEAASGNFEEAAALYRTLVTADPGRAPVWLQLANVKQLQGTPEEARAVVAEGLAANPDAPQLMWADASYKERDGDIDGAIAIYETLYERDSNSLIAANNLASLLATYRDDPESLEQAWRVARRFRDAQIPALQDTYGWIAHRRGESETALPYMEAAAAGLPTDPIVQFHLAETYMALERPQEARPFYQTAVELAGPADTRAQIVKARAQIREIDAATAETPDAQD